MLDFHDNTLSLLEVASVDTLKLKEAIAEAEEQSAKYRRLADDLKAALQRLTSADERVPVIKPRLNLRSRLEPQSTLRASVSALEEIGRPVHIKDLVGMVTERRGKDTPRASIESVLVRAIKDKKFGLKRTAPGTFAVEK